MKCRWTVWLVPMALAILFESGASISAADLYDREPADRQTVVLPGFSELKSLSVYPPAISLRGSDDAAQIVLTASLRNGGLQDLTGDVLYEAANPTIVRVSTTGRVVPLANGG